MPFGHDITGLWILKLITYIKSICPVSAVYGDITYDQTFNMSFQQKVETIQYNAALAITGAIRSFFMEKLYQELGLETLQQGRWYRNLCCFYKIPKSQSPKCLYSIILTHNMSYRTRQCNKIPSTNVKLEFSKNIVFPSTIIEWNKLEWKIKNSKSIENFLKKNSTIH